MHDIQKILLATTRSAQPRNAELRVALPGARLDVGAFDMIAVRQSRRVMDVLLTTSSHLEAGCGVLRARGAGQRSHRLRQGPVRAALEIPDRYQRRGIATAVQRWWLDGGRCLISGARQSSGAHALWRRLAARYLLVYAGVRADLFARMILLGHGWDLVRLASRSGMRLED